MTVLERFNAKWEPVPHCGCWLWTACVRQSDGYGTLGIKGKTKAAHRVSWEIHNGPIPEGLCVLHRCDVPTCVNPDHLFLGTKADNTADMIAKGRAKGYTPGETHHNSKLTRSEVLEIRSGRGVFEKYELAEMYGVSCNNISQIQTRKRWAHVQ